jgi:PKD repeat protein
MKKKAHKLFFFSLLFFLTSCYKEELVNLEADFDVSVINDDYSVPVEIVVNNTSQGADRYQWTFEGGVPENSTQKQPGAVLYRKAGSYSIRLDCWFKDRSVTKTYTLQLDSALYADFNIQVKGNTFAPVSLQIENLSSGASSYRWFFEGGIPSASEEKQPPEVRYENAGEYTVRLEIENQREKKEISRTIQVLPRMEIDFTATFAFEDEDQEAPATIVLESQATSVLQYRWEASGGKIANDTARNTSVYFENPGSYVITLHVDNEKETREISKEIRLKPNTNLVSLQDIRLGVNTSREAGPFFSGRLRRTFVEDEIDEENGKQIDFVFFGLNSRFTYCRFLSPNGVQDFTFQAIPEAIKTYVVNDLGSVNLNFTTATFDAMQNDASLLPLEIKSNDTGDLYFGIDQLPRFILFETGDGRKGVIKIKTKTEAGIESYLTVDIKMQKAPR